MSHVACKKWYCRPVKFKKRLGHPVNFKKWMCLPVDIKKRPCRMSLRSKKGCVAV